MPWSLLLVIVIALVLPILRLLWWWPAPLRLRRLSPIAVVISTLWLLLLWCISGLRIIVVAVVPAVLLIAVLIVAVIVVLLVVLAVVACILLLSLQRVSLIVILLLLLLLLLLARLWAPVVLLLICHGDAGCVIVYRVQQSHIHRACVYRGVVRADRAPQRRGPAALKPALGRDSPQNQNRRLLKLWAGTSDSGKVARYLAGVFNYENVVDGRREGSAELTWEVKAMRLLTANNVEIVECCALQRGFRRHWCHGYALRREVDASMPSSNGRSRSI